MEVIRRRAIVRGQVQGVGFRAGTRSQARALALTGFARNRADGTVEVEVQGPVDRVSQLLSWLESGPRWATVDAVEVSELTPTGDAGFELRR
ncbi:acylphosphatase [Parafrigoribacterium mesophilum]|uniref:acylphosphatase n=1 Tax=Parafrigoribacterium mesophilum TaxID=433646 RepID=UPI0031FC6F70